jgi:hypothetical protein
MTRIIQTDVMAVAVAVRGLAEEHGYDNAFYLDDVQRRLREQCHRDLDNFTLGRIGRRYIGQLRAHLNPLGARPRLKVSYAPPERSPRKPAAFLTTPEIE